MRRGYTWDELNELTSESIVNILEAIKGAYLKVLEFSLSCVSYLVSLKNGLNDLVDLLSPTQSHYIIDLVILGFDQFWSSLYLLVISPFPICVVDVTFNRLCRHQEMVCS